MKNLFLTAVFLLFGFGVFAQEGSTPFVEKQFPGDAKAARVAEKAIEKNASDKTSGVRTTWLANRPRDNWFITLDGGINHLFSEGTKDDLFGNINFKKFNAGIAFGKWFSPVWGLRISGGTGLLETRFDNIARATWYLDGNPRKATAAELGTLLNGEGNYEFSYAQVTLDYMVNLKNLFGKYKPKGFFNPVAYVGVGAVQSWGSKDDIWQKIFDPLGTTQTTPSAKGILNMALKGGLQLNFRLADPLQLYLGVEGLMAPESFDRIVGDWRYEGFASAKVGLTYRFGFRHFIKAEFTDQAMLDALIRENNELRNRTFECPPVPACPPCPEAPAPVQVQEVVVVLDPVFFTLDSSVVRDGELKKVAAAAAYLIANPNAKLEVVGYADVKTGNPSYNMQISKRRVDAVAKILVEKFGIQKDRLVLNHKGDTVQPFAKNEENRATIFVK